MTERMSHYFSIFPSIKHILLPREYIMRSLSPLQNSIKNHPLKSPLKRIRKYKWNRKGYEHCRWGISYLSPRFSLKVLSLKNYLTLWLKNSIWVIENKHWDLWSWANQKSKYGYKQTAFDLQKHQFIRGSYFDMWL